jgi:hypothetical protein
LKKLNWTDVRIQVIESELKTIDSMMEMIGYEFEMAVLPMKMIDCEIKMISVALHSMPAEREIHNLVGRLPLSHVLPSLFLVPLS